MYQIGDTVQYVNRRSRSAYTVARTFPRNNTVDLISTKGQLYVGAPIVSLELFNQAAHTRIQAGEFQS